uniref:Uncharacterized protein n=1 Tax=Nelumbo nucifera TaxID=4432 RepID=A0A822ZFI4_NELNU|nr:TPA_asm: hypothetical protein HUJ06_000741 [Nelumbo nucifera]
MVRCRWFYEDSSSVCERSCDGQDLQRVEMKKLQGMTTLCLHGCRLRKLWVTVRIGGDGKWRQLQRALCDLQEYMGERGREKWGVTLKVTNGGRWGRRTCSFDGADDMESSRGRE